MVRANRLNNSYDVIIVGGGFTGLSAAHALAKNGLKVRIIESDSSVGGLAGTFQFSDGVRLEKFYHHWFNNDLYVPELVSELGMDGSVVTLPTKTGMYFNGRTWNLSKPLDLLRFKPLSFFDRIRLGLLVFKVRKIVDWRSIENLSIREWLQPLCGKKVFEVVWEPLLTSKFSIYAEQVNAVWMWKKLMLRGGTRNSQGGEELSYFKGGFSKLAEALVSEIERLGSSVVTKEKVTGVHVEGNKVISVITDQGIIKGAQYLFTPALPLIANIFSDVANSRWINELRRVRYLGNVCLVLRLKRSLSDTYWLNVNDPGFPFVGVIEHTNFDSSKNYENSHIVYLSRYLSTDDPVWAYSDDDYLDYSFGHLRRMFPELDRSWVIESKVWRAEFAQPITERNYSKYVPDVTTPFENVHISTMAQIYPEDRGTNYAIRDGKLIAKRIAEKFNLYF